MSKRCGCCDNCKKLEKVKVSVLRYCGTPRTRAYDKPAPTDKLTAQEFHHADDGVVAVWNDSLKHYPCLSQQMEQPSKDTVREAKK